MLFLSLCGVVLLVAYSQLLDKRLPYQKAHWRFEVCHFLAGFFVAVGIAAITQNAMAILGVTIVVGILWEIWELMLEYVFSHNFSSVCGWRCGHWTFSDTILDLLLDAVGAGAFLALFYWV